MQKQTKSQTTLAKEPQIPQLHKGMVLTSPVLWGGEAWLAHFEVKYVQPGGHCRLTFKEFQRVEELDNLSKGESHED